MSDDVQAQEGASQESGGEVDVQSQIRAAVEQATASIKTNRDEILQEKRELKDQLQKAVDRFEKLGGDEGVASLIELKTRLEKDELGKLVAEGKHDEWFDKRTAKMRADFENQTQGFQTQLEEATKRAEQAEQRYTGLKIENEVRAACSSSEGFVDTAIADALARASSAFEFDSEKGVVMRDENGGIVLGKDGATPLSVSEWLEEQKKTSRHWWGASQGAGVNGAAGGRSPDASMEAISKMSMADYREMRKKKGLSSGFGAHNI
jgi:hypothetical protein